MLEKLLEWDRDTFIYLNNLGIESYDGFWSLVTNISSWIPLYLFILYLLIRKHPKPEGIYRALYVLLLLLVVLTLTHFTKEAVARLRPNNDLEINTLIRILKSPTGYSFFSGHAATSFSLTTLVVLFLRKRIKWIALLYIWPFIFAFSRIYVGVHYPLDIITGAVIGTLLALIFYGLYRRFIGPYLGSIRPG